MICQIRIVGQVFLKLLFRHLVGPISRDDFVLLYRHGFLAAALGRKNTKLCKNATHTPVL